MQDERPAQHPTAVPPSTDQLAGLSADQLAEARRYSRRKLVAEILDTAIAIGYLVAIVAAADRLDSLLASLPGCASRWPRLIAMFSLVVAGHLLVSFPLDVYSGYWLERRFGLSRQSLGRWLWRLGKRQAIGWTIGALLVGGLYALIWLVGWAWWIVAAVAFFVFTVLLGQLAPVVILPLFYKVRRLEDAELLERFRRLCAGTGLTIEGIYRLDLSVETLKANAALAGLGRTRRVLLSDTLLGGFEPDELEIVLAHELGHHVYRHIPKLIGLGLAFSVAGFYLCDLVLRWRYGVPLDYRALPVASLPLVLLVLAVQSLVFQPLRAAISRRFERQCDRYALQRTGNKAAYRSTFEKLARQNKADPAPHPLEVLLFHDHPPIAERLKLAD